MAEAKKARAVGLNHVALEVGDILRRLWLFTVVCLTSSFAARAPPRLSSIWATNFSHCREGELKRLTMDVILGLWSTTRMPSVRRSLTRG